MGESDLERRQDLGAAAASLLALYDTHFDAVYGFLVKRCGSVELAEDFVQEVFVAAAQRANDGEVPAPAWLYSVARSRLVDHWRREARRERKLRVVGARSGLDHEDIAETVVSGERVLAALSSVPTDQRAALSMRYLDGRSVKEIAETIGRSVRATESLLVRARHNLERAYDEVGHD